MNIHFFNTYLQGGAAYGAINLFRNLNNINSNIDTLFFLKKDLSNGIKLKRLNIDNKFHIRDPLALNNTILNKISNSIKARLYYYNIKKQFEGRPDKYELFSPTKQYYSTPYYWFSKKLPDIIHLHWIAEWIDYPSFLNSIPNDIPIVWTLHDMNPFTGGCHYSWSCKKYISYCRSCNQLAKPSETDLSYLNWQIKLNHFQNKNLHIVGDSNWITNEAKKSPLFKKAKSFRTIHYSIDFNIFKPNKNKNKVLAKYNIPKGTFIICFGATDYTNRRKGFPELINALKIVNKKNKNIHCLVFGEGKLNNNIKELLPPIHYTGKLNPKELADVYSASDIFIIPSLYEAFGLTAIESMACGTPVLGFNSGGIPDSVNEGISGWLAEKNNINDLANKILYLFEDRAEVKKIGKSAVSFARENFNKNKETNNYIELYKSISL